MRVHQPFAVLFALVLFTGCEALQSAVSTPPAKQPGGAAKPAPGGSRGAPAIVLGSPGGRAGNTVSVSATLQTGGASIAGTQNDIGFDPQQIAIAAKGNGKPDCQANTAIGKEGTAFNFLPSGCKPGTGGGCSSMRALVLSLSSVDAIPNGSVLYTCKVQIAPQARPGAHPLTLSRVGFSDPKGTAIDGRGASGKVTVGKMP
jgi:hypothetical protein